MQIKQLLQQVMQSLATPSDAAAMASTKTPQAAITQAQQATLQSVFNALTSQLQNPPSQPQHFNPAPLTSQLNVPAQTVTAVTQQLEQLLLRVTERATDTVQPPPTKQAQTALVNRMVEQMVRSDARISLPTPMPSAQTDVLSRPASTSIALAQLPQPLRQAVTEQLQQWLGQWVKAAQSQATQAQASPPRLTQLPVQIEAVSVKQGQLVMQLTITPRTTSEVSVPFPKNTVCQSD